MEKINIAELLKNCPTGMELDCTIFENLEFNRIDKDNENYSIICCVKTEWGGYNTHTFTKYGCYTTEKYAKCVIFPKGKTTWEGFVPPCKFKDGDVLTYMYHNKPTIYIYRENGCCNTSFYAGYSSENKQFYKGGIGGLWGNGTDLRLATEEEKQLLFDVIKDNGYKWHPETKTLEKLIEPIFKKGDTVRCINNIDMKFKIIEITDNYYLCENNFRIYFKFQEYWEICINYKFNINTLKPFESKVLVRHYETSIWMPAIFGGYDIPSLSYYVVGGTWWRHCIPYKGNEYLRGTTNDCNDYYKTWEE